jgi:hypothetical protein
MKKLLKVLLELLKGMRACVLVFMMMMMEICIALADHIEKKIDAVANYILKKYE